MTRYRSLPRHGSWQEKLQPKPHTFHLVATLDDRVTGHLSLHVEPRPRRSHVATFGMAVAAGHQGRGIGSALMREMIDLCDNWLRVDRIELTVFADNKPAIAVYKNTDLRSKAPASVTRCATVNMWMHIIWRE